MKIQGTILRNLEVLLCWSVWATLAMAAAQSAYSQAATPDAAQNQPASDDPTTTMFPHSETSRYWISGQDNIIFQYHPSFEASYSGPNSLASHAQDATSNVSTLFLGYELDRHDRGVCRH